MSHAWALSCCKRKNNNYSRPLGSLEGGGSRRNSRYSRPCLRLRPVMVVWNLRKVTHTYMHRDTQRGDDVERRGVFMPCHAMLCLNLIRSGKITRTNLHHHHQNCKSVGFPKVIISGNPRTTKAGTQTFPPSKDVDILEFVAPLKPGLAKEQLSEAQEPTVQKLHVLPTSHHLKIITHRRKCTERLRVKTYAFASLRLVKHALYGLRGGTPLSGQHTFFQQVIEWNLVIFPGSTHGLIFHGTVVQH